MVAISNQEAERLVDVFLELGVSKKPINRELLRRDVEHLLTVYWGHPLKEIKIGPLLGEVFGVMRDHHLQLPANLALLLKTVIMIEGIGTNLDPDFQFASVLAPYTQQLVIEQYSPIRWLPRFGRASIDLARLGVELPQQVRRMMGAAERGNLQIGMRPEGFDPLVDRFERISNRIVLGVIAAAFINGLAVLMSVYRPPGWEHWAWAVFAFGFICALVLGTHLAWNILRSTRH